MISAWDVYWITRLDYFHGTLVFFIVICSLIAIPCFMYAVAKKEDSKCPWGHREDDVKTANFFFKLSLYPTVCGLVFLILITFVPTTKHAVVIYLLPKIANNEQVQKLPDNALKLMNNKMEAWIDEMAEKKKR